MKIYCWVFTELLKELLIINLFLNKHKQKKINSKNSILYKKQNFGGARGQEKVIKNVAK